MNAAPYITSLWAVKNVQFAKSGIESKKHRSPEITNNFGFRDKIRIERIIRNIIS